MFILISQDADAGELSLNFKLFNSKTRFAVERFLFKINLYFLIQAPGSKI